MLRSSISSDSFRWIPFKLILTISTISFLTLIYTESKLSIRLNQLHTYFHILDNVGKWTGPKEEHCPFIILSINTGRETRGPQSWQPHLKVIWPPVLRAGINFKDGSLCSPPCPFRQSLFLGLTRFSYSKVRLLLVTLEKGETQSGKRICPRLQVKSLDEKCQINHLEF